MKKLFVLVLCAATVFSLGSCKPKQIKKAADVALEHANMIKDGKYDLFVEEFHFEPSVTAEAAKAEKETVKRNLKTHVHPAIQAKGSIKQSSVVSEKVSPDGKKATVQVRHDYNNGQSDVLTYDLAQVGDTWKLANGHLRDVWETTTATGEHLTVKLKENSERAAMKENFEDGERDRVKVQEGENREVLKVEENGDRDIVKVKEQKDGDVIVKEKADGKRDVTKIEPDGTVKKR